MAKVRVARAFRLPIIAAMTALALSGCMHATGPVAVAQPQSDLDSLAYGEPHNPYQAGVSSSSNGADSGGAISALRNAFAAAPQRYYPPAQAAYAAAPMPAPMPVAYDAAYRLAACDKLRVGRYGQEGLTDPYAIYFPPPTTLPPIRSFPARRR